MVGGDDLEEAAAAAAAGESLAASRDREFKVITVLLPTLLRVDDEAPVWLLCPGGEVADAEEAALLPPGMDLLVPPLFEAPSLTSTDKRALLFLLE